MFLNQLLFDNLQLNLHLLHLLFELELEKFIHSDISMPQMPLSDLPAHFEVRMAALFGEVEQPNLSSLKLSRTESTGIKLLCDKNRFCAEISEKNARRLLAVYGDLCEDAVALHGTGELLELVINERQKNPALSIDQLAVSGGELLSHGIEPRNIGRIMERLLSLVIDTPELNEKSKLLSLAEELSCEVS